MAANSCDSSWVILGVVVLISCLMWAGMRQSFVPFDAGVGSPVSGVATTNPMYAWISQLVYPVVNMPLRTTGAPTGPHIFTRYVLPTDAPEGVRLS